MGPLPVPFQRSRGSRITEVDTTAGYWGTGPIACAQRFVLNLHAGSHQSRQNEQYFCETSVIEMQFEQTLTRKDTAVP